MASALPRAAFSKNGSDVAGTETVAKAGRELQRRSGGWVVIKLGADGCMAFGPHGGRLASPAPVVEPQDTTGAGDAFNAGLVAALAAGQDWPDALAAATGFASSVVARPSNNRHAVQNRTAGEAV